jgi:type I restriction-modification system DNA methylase subunit
MGKVTHRLPRYLLGLVFLKHLSDSSAQANGNPPRTGVDYVVPREAQWDRVASDPTGKALLEAVRAVESHPENTDLAGIFTALGLPKLADELELFGGLINHLPVSDRSTSSRELPAAVDLLIEQSIRRAGWRGGEHYTPPDLALLLAGLLDPQSASTIYDPACGTGMLQLPGDARPRSDTPPVALTLQTGSSPAGTSRTSP